MNSQKNDPSHHSQHDSKNHDHSSDQSCKHDPAKKCCKHTSSEGQSSCQDHQHHHDHHHHDHEHCGHDHHHHDHEHCGHDHHHHDHEHCGHDHSPEQYTRYNFSPTELSEFAATNFEDLIQTVNGLLEHELYGKAVPVLEVIMQKIRQESGSAPDTNKYFYETQHHLALTYGIIGEHKNSSALWQSIIAHFESANDTNELFEAYYNAALSSEQAGNEQSFLSYLTAGLEKALESKHEEWEATFEHELAVYHFEKQNLPVSEQKLLRSISIFTKQNNEESLVASYYYLAYLKEKLEQINDAKNLYDKALQLAKKEHIRDFVEYERSMIEERLANINKKLLKEKLLDF